MHRRHRGPATWRWQASQPAITFRKTEPEKRLGGAVALILALGATVNENRIQATLGPGVAIWSLTVENPHNDILRRPEDQSVFKVQLRKLPDRIEAFQGDDAVIDVFLALPSSAAVEVGWVRMPKADLPMIIHDRNRSAGGPIKTIEIRPWHAVIA